jgi:hypothetical protein
MMNESPPDRIFLQWYGDEDPKNVRVAPDDGDVTWCNSRVFNHDIEYVRVSIHDELREQVNAKYWQKVREQNTELGRLATKHRERCEEAMARNERLRVHVAFLERQLKERGEL